MIKKILSLFLTLVLILCFSLTVPLPAMAGDGSVTPKVVYPPNPLMTIFRPGGTWFMDLNRDGMFDAGDWTNAPNIFGRQPGDIPLAVDWNGDSKQELAIFRPGGTWFIDLNHDGVFEPGVDWTNSPNTFGGQAGDIPVVTDWNGDGTEELGIFRQGGTWFFDLNHDGVFEPGVDWTNSPNTFGAQAGDIPLAVGWDGRGHCVIFRPGGTWFFEFDNNGRYDPNTDWTNSPNTYGRQAGDIPLAVQVGWGSY
jgi:hypothetical protein